MQPGEWNVESPRFGSTAFVHPSRDLVIPQPSQLSLDRLRWVAWIGAALFLTAVATLGAPATFEADEARYVFFAENLSRGFYSPADEIRLENGPGYPMVLVPFVALGLPWMAARLLNALLVLLAALMVERVLRRWISPTAALTGALAYVAFPTSWSMVPLLMTEPLSEFLVAAVAWVLVSQDRAEGSVGQPAPRWLRWPVLSVLLASLAMTKVIFVPALVVSAVLIGALAIVQRAIGQSVRFHGVLLGSLLFALALCAPYLAYTSSLTGQFPFFSSVGGSNLYWMATPHTQESGDWNGLDLAQLERAAARQGGGLLERHGSFFHSLEELDAAERDRVFRQQASEWIAEDPAKYASNWLHNLGRLWLGQPYDGSPQRLSKLVLAVPGSVLLASLVWAVAAALRWPRLVPRALWLLFAFAAIGLGGTSLVAAGNRMLAPFLPILFLWPATLLGRTVRWEAKREQTP